MNAENLGGSPERQQELDDAVEDQLVGNEDVQNNPDALDQPIQGSKDSPNNCNLFYSQRYDLDMEAEGANNYRDLEANAENNDGGMAGEADQHVEGRDLEGHPEEKFEGQPEDEQEREAEGKLEGEPEKEQLSADKKSEEPHETPIEVEAEGNLKDILDIVKGLESLDLLLDDTFEGYKKVKEDKRLQEDVKRTQERFSPSKQAGSILKKSLDDVVDSPGVVSDRYGDSKKASPAVASLQPKMKPLPGAFGHLRPEQEREEPEILNYVKAESKYPGMKREFGAGPKFEFDVGQKYEPGLLLGKQEPAVSSGRKFDQQPTYPRAEYGAAKQTATYTRPELTGGYKDQPKPELTRYSYKAGTIGNAPKPNFEPSLPQRGKYDYPSYDKPSTVPEKPRQKYGGYNPDTSIGRVKGEDKVTAPTQPPYKLGQAGADWKYGGFK